MYENTQIEYIVFGVIVYCFYIVFNVLYNHRKGNKKAGEATKQTTGTNQKRKDACIISRVCKYDHSVQDVKRKKDL